MIAAANFPILTYCFDIWDFARQIHQASVAQALMREIGGARRLDRAA
jgi:hypothetical protein